MKLVLEINENCIDKTRHYTTKNSQDCIMVCPPVGENYWIFRVKLCKDQAVLGFPKYGLVGVGMALEDNGNTNLPISTNVSDKSNGKRIARHIQCNKKYKSITTQMIEDAIILISQVAKQKSLASST